MKLLWPLLKLIKRTHRIDLKYFFFQMFCFPFSFTTFDCHGGNCLTELHFKKPSKSFFAFLFYFIILLLKIWVAGGWEQGRGVCRATACARQAIMSGRESSRGHTQVRSFLLSLSHTHPHTHTHTHTHFSYTHILLLSLPSLTLIPLRSGRKRRSLIGLLFFLSV